MKHIMFDLDGTLLALDFDEFTRAYIACIGQKLGTLGYDVTRCIKALWAGTEAMVKNDGSRTNRQAFWDAFCAVAKVNQMVLEPQLETFYRQEFQGIRSVLRTQRDCRGFIDDLKRKGYTLSLATNPVFPLVAVEQRLSWIGLTVKDFAVVSSYEHYKYCKPNLGYYQQVLSSAGFAPEESCMIGNNIHDDMPARDLGMPVYLVTDVLENPQNKPVDDYPHGSFAQLQAFLAALPPVKNKQPKRLLRL